MTQVKKKIHVNGLIFRSSIKRQQTVPIMLRTFVVRDNLIITLICHIQQKAPVQRTRTCQYPQLHTLNSNHFG